MFPGCWSGSRRTAEMRVDLDEARSCLARSKASTFLTARSKVNLVSSSASNFLPRRSLKTPITKMSRSRVILLSPNAQSETIRRRRHAKAFAVSLCSCRAERNVFRFSKVDDFPQKYSSSRAYCTHQTCLLDLAVLQEFHILHDPRRRVAVPSACLVKQWPCQP